MMSQRSQGRALLVRTEAVTDVVSLDSPERNRWALKLLPSGVRLNGSIADGELLVTRQGAQLLGAGARTPQLLKLVETPMHEARLHGRSVVCFSDQNPYFAFLALKNGASEVLIADRSAAFCEMVSQAASHLEFTNMAHHAAANVLDLPSETEVLLLLDSKYCNLSTHEISSHGASHGASGSSASASVSERDQRQLVEKLSQVVNTMLVVAWAPQPGSQPAADQKQYFAGLLSEKFKRVKELGSIGADTFFQAFKENFEIDLRCPLPPLSDDLEIVNCKLLINLEGLEYWSRVYRADDAYLKQTSFDLAFREQSLLSSLDSEYFPKIYGYEPFMDYGVVTMERVHGEQLSHCYQSIAQNEKSFLQLIRDCLEILSQLQVAGINHRDISDSNIIMRDDKPVLIDFSWGVTAERPMFTPDGLTPFNRDAQVSDVVSMGNMLKRIAENRYPLLSVFFDLMTDVNPDCRILSAEDLKTVLTFLTSESRLMNRQPTLAETLLRNLVAGRVKYDSMLARFYSVRDLAQEEGKFKLVFLEAEHSNVTSELTRVVADLERVESEKNHYIEVAKERELELSSIYKSRTWKLAKYLQRIKGNLFRQ